MNGLNYLLQSNLYMLLFMGFYVLVLREETFFRQNRFFLNTSIFLSFVIPFINSDWFRDLFITQKVREAAIMPTQIIYETIIVGANVEASLITISDAIFWIYASGATFLLIRFIVRLAFLQTSLKAEKGAAFSFFNTLVVDAEIPKSETIINHEKVHMRQWHSADIIFIELAAIVNWFNPVMYLYKKEIRHIHEFIADEEAATLMNSKSDYALLLFSNTLGVDPLHLSNNFFNKSLLKRRILMLHKNRSRSTGLWKYGFSAPLFVLMLIVSAATVKSEKTIQPVAEAILSPLPAETSKEILSALELNKPALRKTVKLKNSSSNTNPEEELEVHPDFNTLKRFLVRTLKYPPAPRDNKETGMVIVNFGVEGQKVSKVSFVKKMHIDIEADVVKSLMSYASQLDVPDDNYMLAIKYNLAGLAPTADFVPRSIHKNFIGQLTVNAWIGSNSQKTGMSTQPLIGIPEDDALSQFPGGLKAWSEYISKNLRYPKSARDNRIQGRTVLSFVVDTDGSIKDIKVLRGIGGGTDEEAVRVVAQSPKWKPLIKDGIAVKTAYTLPIEFNLGNNSSQNTAQNSVKIPAPPLIDGVLDFSTVEVLPEVDGGIAAWGKYLSANLKYSELARKANVTGRVIMGFIVEKDGSLADIKVIKGLGSGLDEEAVRVLKSAPKWKPGLLDGRPVRVAYTMPIFFQLGPK